VSVTVLAVVALGVPLGVAAARVYRDREVNRLERAATRAALALPAAGLSGGGRIALPQRLPIHTALYDIDGTRVSGSGPRRGDTEVRAALRGRVTEDRD